MKVGFRRACPSLLLLTATACGGCAAPEPSGSGSPAEGAVAALGRAYHGGEADRTLGDLRAIASALTARMVDAGGYPAGGDLAAMAAVLEPVYLRSVPRSDAWGRPLRYRSDGSGFTLSSDGLDGLPGTDDDLVQTDGSLR